MFIYAHRGSRGQPEDYRDQTLTTAQALADGASAPAWESVRLVVRRHPRVATVRTAGLEHTQGVLDGVRLFPGNGRCSAQPEIIPEDCEQEDVRLGF